MEGSGRGVFIIIGVILLVITLCYPHQVYFVLKFLWDIIVLNLQPLIDGIHKYFPSK